MKVHVPGGRRRLVGGAAVLLALTAAACASTVSGSGTASVASTAASSTPDFPTATVAPPTPSATLLPPPSSSTPTPAPDITSVNYRIPRGFVRSRAFHPVTPLERSWLARYLVPSNERRGLDVISILLYRLPAYVRVDTLAEQKARVHYYNRVAGARVQNGIHLEVIAGRPAIQENAIEQGTYRYAAWFVFSRRHLVQVSCQVDQQVNKVARGCQTVLNSMTLR